jgi:hypothetical protein
LYIFNVFFLLSGRLLARGGGVQLNDPSLLDVLRADLAPALAALDAEAGHSSGSSSSSSGGFGPLTAGRLVPLKLLQLLVPALRYCERCGDAEALLKVVAAENKDAAVWCAAEAAKIEALRQGKDSGDAAFKRGKVSLTLSSSSSSRFFFFSTSFYAFLVVSCFHRLLLSSALSIVHSLI